MNLRWKGDDLIRQTRLAGKGAIAELAGEAAKQLRRDLPRRSGRLRRSIRVIPARLVHGGVAGGVKGAFYGLLGRNRRIIKGVERAAQEKLADRIGKTFGAKKRP